VYRRINIERMINMKALTLKEPWATLVVNGYKTYEFRSWKTNYRGKILIHAGMSKENKVLPIFEKYNLDYSCGEIIGEAEIIDCILVDEEFSKKLNKINKDVYYKDTYIGKYAWVLSNMKKYEKTIPIKGKLGLWNYDYKNNK